MYYRYNKYLFYSVATDRRKIDMLAIEGHLLECAYHIQHLVCLNKHIKSNYENYLSFLPFFGGGASSRYLSYLSRGMTFSLLQHSFHSLHCCFCKMFCFCVCDLLW